MNGESKGNVAPALRGLLARLRGTAKNSSDPQGVLQAGWSAMQTTDPRLAQAVVKLPPQLAQQAVLQYTNAIRSGKETEAGKIATDFIRTGLESYAQSQAAQPSQPGRVPVIRFGKGSGAGSKYPIADVNAFDAYLAPKPEQGPGGLLGNRFRGLVGQVQPVPVDPQKASQAIQSVKKTYDEYALSGLPEEERAVAQHYVYKTPDQAKLKQLSVPEDWTPALPSEDGSDSAVDYSLGYIRQRR